MTRTQADVAVRVRDWLACGLLGASVLPAILPFSLGEAGSEVRLSVPARWTAASGPLLVVADDGGPTVMPVATRQTIRLTGYAAGRTEARGLVARAVGLLAAGVPGVHIPRDVPAILDARDRATGAWVASALISTVTRTVRAS